MLEIRPIEQTILSYVAADTARLRWNNEHDRSLAPPASPLASPTETARNTVNQAAAYPLMMAPTSDGIFRIGAAAIKVSPISSSRGTSSWGF